MYQIDKERVVWRKVDEEETIVLDTDTGFYFVFNDIAAEILDNIASGMTKEELVKDIVKRYETSEEVVRNDVEELLAALSSENLIEEH